MNRCDSDGWVVDARELPDDAVDYDVERLPKIGCTRIRCRRCGALVRSVPRLKLINVSVPDASLDLKRLYGMPDLMASGLFKASSMDRFYLCECTYHREGEEHALSESDGSYYAIAGNMWACEGHPLADLPHDFDGATVTPANLESIVDDALHGRFPPRARDADKKRAFWLARLYARLAHTPHAAAIVAAVSSRADSADAGARARALHFFMHVTVDEGARRAHALLAGDRALYRGVRDELTRLPQDSTLEHTLWRVAAPLVAAGPARDLARSDALAGHGSRALFEVLGARDGEWLVQNAEAIVQAEPARGGDLVAAMKLCRLPVSPALSALAGVK